MAVAPALRSLLFPTFLLIAAGAVTLWLNLKAGDTHSRRQMAIPQIATPIVRSALPASPSPSPAAEAPNAGETAPASTPETPAAAALAPAPLSEMTESGPFGLIPRKSPDGRSPWRVYARPTTPSPDKPRLAVVITGLGQQPVLTRDAVQAMPADITLSFSPYTDNLQGQMDEVRKKGFETLIEVPMETLKRGQIDQGPYELQASISLEENIDRLKWVISRAQGNVGLVNLKGDKFVRFEGPLKAVLKEIADRGLLFIDNGAFTTSETLKLGQSSGLELLTLSQSVDERLQESAVRQGLESAVSRVRDQKTLIIHAQAYPLTLKTLAAWLAKLPADIQLVPVSALARERYPEKSS